LTPPRKLLTLSPQTDIDNKIHLQTRSQLWHFTISPHYSNVTTAPGPAAETFSSSGRLTNGN
jgi:hypothetical protein